MSLPIHSNKGFSFLELVIVMAVIAILASIVAPNLLQLKLNKMNNLAYESANKFFIKAVDHFADVGGNKTVHPVSLDFKWYVLDQNITAVGSLTDTAGVISSSIPLEFKHKKSARTYALSSLGVISIK